MYFRVWTGYVFSSLLAELTREAARRLRKEYVDGGYDFDLMASLGVCMKSIRLICAGADVSLASAVPKGGSELNLKVKQLDVVAWKPFYPDQLTIGCPDVLHDAQVPDHCYFISNYKVNSKRFVEYGFSVEL